ncbi:16S rRNA (uracil(1498)-N(3))-methyltransferase [Pelistega ratti]|uniref:16S rRNA (uracil(1498)-N(3))-methyltransferase n=1 Tax=Pelistega ratti TaxID=2652177 RepID=UPI001FAAE5D7|nr:16S rRNA (uracil(1498)-N(3))-methyltransferase [Pelistega ratti]
MALPRFFCPIPLQINTIITLPPEVAHHAGRSLRLKEGTRIILFNGLGGEYHGTLLFNQGTAQADLDFFDSQNRGITGNITLVQALASGDKMDWIIEKAVEMGVSHLIPIKAERSILQLSGTRLEKRQQHWQAIIQSASEQSGRNILMTLSPLQTLKQFFQSTVHANYLLADPEGDISLTHYLNQHHNSLNNIYFFIGPEGGWSPKETEEIVKHGATRVRFGDSILRTETAGIALSSAAASVLNWR